IAISFIQPYLPGQIGADWSWLIATASQELSKKVQEHPSQPLDDAWNINQTASSPPMVLGDANNGGPLPWDYERITDQ
ncbi:MAG: hypothetical protein LBG70_00640, partial [Bifidobacteriaceae bacterium]|nr:hypothetical protein [Bifidobacteriaceae bacterium]